MPIRVNLDRVLLERRMSLTELADRARNSYWLNPEAESVWGTGDSAATRYAQVIQMYECRNVTQLGEVIADLLPV